MQPKPYRFTLTGRQEFIDDNGNKHGSTDELLLDHLPGGWKDYSVKWGMHRAYFGYGRTLGFNLRFFKKAADMLRMYFDIFGIDADVTLKVEKGNMATYEYDFEAEFDIDFRQFESFQHYVEIGLCEKGISQMLESNENNTYDIPMTDGAMVHVDNGMNLLESIEYFSPLIYYLVLSEPVSYPIPIKIKSSNIYTNYFNFNEIDFYYPYSKPIEIMPFFNVSKIEETLHKNIRIRVNINTEIGYFYGNYVKEGINVTLAIRQYDKDGNIVLNHSDYLIWEHFFNKGDNIESINIETYIYLMDISECKFSLILSIAGIDEGTDPEHLKFATTYFKNVNITYYGFFTTSPFSFHAYQLQDWGQKIFEKMRGTDDYNFTDRGICLSQYRDRIMVTSADAIRGLEGAVGKGNFRDFYNSVTGIIGCGAAIEGNEMYFFPYDAVFDPITEIADIGSVSRIKASPFVDWIKNRFKFGYPNKDYDKLNGRQEFNTTVEFTSPVKNADESERSFVGKYRADSFGIQWLRWEYLKNDSKDSRSDNDMFFVAVRRMPDGRLVVEQDVQHNLEQKGLFNYFLSPKRNMIRNGGLLAAYCDKAPPQSHIKFASSEKVDSKLVSEIYDDENGIVAETDDISISDLMQNPLFRSPLFRSPLFRSPLFRSPLFRPLLFEFDSAAQFSLPQHMKSPRGFIKFNYFGLELKGFVYEVTEASTPKKAQEFKLIAHPDTPYNVSRLIAEAGRGKTAV